VSQGKSNFFSRFVLPGFAFKAAVIGGGYATGRELAAFFLPSGPLGGVYAILTAILIWSVVCALTFIFAVETRSTDYRTFFKHLLGRFWWIYELAFFLAIIVILAVFAAASGAIGASLFGWPQIAGALLLMVSIVAVAASGNSAVEHVFKYSSYFLYGTYAVFTVLVLSKFGDQVSSKFAQGVPPTGWLSGGITYASYNIIGAITILPVTRHLTSRRDALVAGLLAGPMAMLPALFFFLCMVAFYPVIGDYPLPSDFLLEKLNIPIFRFIFQAMIFTALFETGIVGVNAIIERATATVEEKGVSRLPKGFRVGLATLILSVAVFFAGRFGIVALVANGYRWLAYTFLVIYALPLLTYGLWRVTRGTLRPLAPAPVSQRQL